MRINIPKNVELILNKLIETGYEAYIVGGCVRDSILGLKPKDWDITTSAKPNQIIEIFKNYNVIPTGLKHGTVTIVVNNEQFEITTYRIDGVYNDGRHPSNVVFTSDLKEDLSRRDFTINAMAYNEERGLVDYFGGLKDLVGNKIIKTVGDPSQRFQEDGLRIMRAIRFSAKFNFQIEYNTKIAIINNSSNLKNISKERIREEFNKILIYNPSKILEMNELCISGFICNEFKQMDKYNQNNPYHTLDLLQHSIYSTKIVDNLELKLTMIFHDIGKLECETIDDKGISHYKGHGKFSSNKALKILKDLKYSNDIINNVITLTYIHDYNFADDDRTIKKQLKRLLNKYGENIVKSLLKVRIADISAQNPIYLLNRLNKVYRVKGILDNILKTSECFTIKDLDINGYDLINLGYKGKEIGDILNEILQLVIDEKLNNTKNDIIDFLT